mmetsp:Transcript_826/g.2277  ORF Transcript_826/g.2277 Transcript_826/m.2277 type:complete len:399 (+) Transcript_826:57-1253(+)
MRPLPSPPRPPQPQKEAACARSSPVAGALKAAVKATKSCKEEGRKVLLLLDLRAPVPAGREPAVDAGAAVVAAAVEAVAEEVLQNHHPQALHSAKLLVYQPLRGSRRLVDLRQLVEDADDGRQDARHLCVLVDEEECVGHVPVPQVHHAEAHPAAHFALHLVEDGLHQPRNPRRRLHAVETLSRVAEPVAQRWVQQIFLSSLPEREHAPHDLAPQQQALEHKGVLRPVAVREARASSTPHDLQGPITLTAGIEVCLQEPNYSLAGLAVETLEGKVVAHGLDNRLDVVGRERRALGPPAPQQLPEVARGLGRLLALGGLLREAALQLRQGLRLLAHLRYHLCAHLRALVDLARGRQQQRVLQQLRPPLLRLQHRGHSLDRRHALEAHRAGDLVLDAVLQ